MRFKYVLYGGSEVNKQERMFLTKKGAVEAIMTLMEEGDGPTLVVSADIIRIWDDKPMLSIRSTAIAP